MLTEGVDQHPCPVHHTPDGRVDGGAYKAFLQVDDEQGRLGVQGRQRHGFSLESLHLLAGWDGSVVDQAFEQNDCCADHFQFLDGKPCLEVSG